MASIDGVPSAGEVVAGKYILRERLGEGGMGIVFLADQPSLGRTVAIKLLQPALVTYDSLVRRFHTEAVAACRVQHPGAVAVIDYGISDDGTPFIAMEHVPGRPLSEVIAEEEIALSRALKIVRQLLRTLRTAHAQGVIHADIKSDNLMLERTREGGDAITVIDFGLARLDGHWDYGDPVSGTPEYMAPETIAGEPPTVASDLYSVGMILYELLTGCTPFGGGAADDILRRQVEDEAVPPSLRRPDRDISAALDRIVLRAIDKDPRARFRSAEEFLQALAALPQLGAERGAAAGRPRCAPRSHENPTAPAMPRSLHGIPVKKAS